MTPDEIKTWIEEKASEQEIYPHKHKDRSAYDTRMLYEINDERYDAAEKCATALYTLLSGELENKDAEIERLSDKIRIQKRNISDLEQRLFSMKQDKLKGRH